MLFVWRFDDLSLMFSVLIPVYNVEKYLTKCVDSVLNQTYTDYEIILLDDGSTDKSGEICDEYSARYSNISVFHQLNAGLLLTRCRLIRRARGSFCVFLDSDDWLRQDALEVISNTINRENCDVVMYNYCRVNENQTFENAPVFSNGAVFFGENKKALYDKFFESSYLNNMWTKAVKRSLFDNIIDYERLAHRISLGEDALVSMHVYHEMKRLVYIDEALYYYRYNPNSLTAKKKPDAYLDYNFLFEQRWNFMQNLGIYDSTMAKKYATRYMSTISACLRSNYGIDKEKLISYFNDIRHNTFFNKMNEMYDPKMLKIREHIAVKLFVSERFNMLIMYSCILHVISKFKKTMKSLWARLFPER